MAKGVVCFWNKRCWKVDFFLLICYTVFKVIQEVRCLKNTSVLSNLTTKRLRVATTFGIKHFWSPPSPVGAGWHSRGQRFDPAYLHHRSLENHWFSRLFSIRRYFYFARYFSDQSFDQNYEMSKKSNLFQEVGGLFSTSRFFHTTFGNCTTLQAPSVGLSGSVASEVKALLNLAMASWRMLSCTWR